MQAPRPTWASTLRLPKSTFPPRALPGDRPKYLKRCTDDLYAWQKTCQTSQPTFTLHDGPPYANGSLHIGHALNKILKDIANRTQLLFGRRVNYVPGWDCHGLPIELKSLQKQKENGRIDNASQLGAVTVRQAARQLALEAVEEQKAGFRDWAVMGDWDGAWKTLDKGFELRQLGVFKSMLSKGLIYRRFKPVYWSPSSRTALAEAELEYNPEHESTAVYVKFPLIGLPASVKAVVGEERVSAVIWTTTPWTLLANKAVAVHRELEYTITRSEKHGLLVVGKGRLEDMSKMWKEDLFENQLATILGSNLLSAQYRHPAFGDSATRQPIFHGDYVSAESGSGLVHTAPGHGMDDYKLCLQNGIEPFAPLDDSGRFTKEAYPPQPELFAGKEVLGDGNRAVLDFLIERNAVISSNKYKHNYPYDWRSKRPVITRATQQWFADVSEIRDDTLKSLEDVKFLPESGKDRLSSFIKNRSEWCISRQRSWGVPIPALYEKGTDKALLTPESVDHVVKVIGERGIDAWWTDEEFDEAWVSPPIRGGVQYYRGRDTMDVWFDSGTSWTEMSKDPDNKSPVADMYIEGTDQHRGWFQSSLLTKIASGSDISGKKTAPYRTLITHGFTLDQDGKKMSKSLGNVISPSEIMAGTLLPPLKPRKIKGQSKKDQPVTYDGMGTDALRLWVAGCDYTKDVVVGTPVLKAVNSSLSKLRVTFRLLTGLLDTLSPQTSISFDSLNLNDQMVLIALRKLRETVLQNFKDYEYHRAVAAINQFINADLSAVYIESVKDRMYADAVHSDSRVQAQLVLWEIFRGLTSLLSPLTPLLVEEALDHLPEQLRGLYHPLGDYQSESAGKVTPVVDGPWVNNALEEEGGIGQIFSNLNATIKTLQEQARSQKLMGSSLQSWVRIEVASVYPVLGDQGGDLTVLLKKYQRMLEDLFVVSNVKIVVRGSAEPLPEHTWKFEHRFEMMGNDALITVYEPQQSKCIRCWKYTVVKDDEFEEDICHRCVGVVVRSEQDGVDEVFEGKPKLEAVATLYKTKTGPPELERHR